MIKTLKYFLEALVVYSFFLVIKIIGLSLSRKFFALIFRCFGSVIKPNKIIDKNLKYFDKEISDLKKKEIISGMWSNYGMTFVEYIFLKKFRQEDSHIKIVGKDILKNIIDKKKPVVFISGHFANFELMSMEITKAGVQLATIYRPLNNFFLNPFMEYLRKKYVCQNQIKKGRKSMREIVNYIEKKNSIALMIDQRLSEGEKISFFKKEALTTTLPAQLALKYNLDIVPIFIERKNNNSFEMVIYEALNISNFKNKIEISNKLNEVLENMIVKKPNQWIWTHNRWK
tara:strand:- start:2555 stop:3412 length:858 start_codon:yes stop_codon:yes gene_type:complete